MIKDLTLAQEPVAVTAPKHTHLLKDAFILLVGAGIAGLLLLGRSLLLAQVLGPYEYGWVALFVMLITYAMYLQLGTLSGMFREVPLSIGAGNWERGRSIQQAALGYILGLMVTAMVVGGLIALIFVRGKGYWRLLPLVTALFAFMMLIEYIRTCLRSQSRFPLLACFNVVFSALSLVLAVAGASLWGVSGALWGMIAATIIALLVYNDRSWFSLPEHGVTQDVISLMRLGLPLMGIGALNEVLLAIDQVTVASYLGPKELGIYNVAFTLANAFVMWLGMFSQVLYPRLSARVGQSPKHERELFVTVRQWLLFNAGLFPIVVAGLIAFSQTFFAFALPAFEQSSALLQVLIVGLSLTGFGGIVATYTMAAGPHSRLLKAIGWSIGINVVLVGSAALLRGDTLAIALAATTGYVMYFVLVTHSSLSTLCRDLGEEVRLIASVLIAVSYGAFIGGAVQDLDVTPKIISLAVGLSPLVALAIRHRAAEEYPSGR